MSNETHKEWIIDDLMPSLVSTGKIPCDCECDEAKSRGNVVIKNCVVEKLSVKDGFMLTQCYRIRLTIGCLCQHQHTVGIVVKITPSVDEATYRACQYEDLFKNEIIAYEELLPAVGRSIPACKYYYSHNRPLEAAIALNDFTMHGWRMSKSMVNLSLDHILLSVKELGRFHGEFYAMKHKHLEQFTAIRGKFVESRFQTNPTEQWYRLLNIGIKRAILAVKESSLDIPVEFLDQMGLTLSEVFNYQRDMVKAKEPLAVMCHGDYLRNNIAFAYENCNDEDAEVPTAALMFDYQTLRYSSPMVDLTTFMANSTGVDVRSKHFKDIFAAYYNELIRNYCVKAGTSINELPEMFCYDTFLREYAVYLPFGLSIAASFLPILHVPQECEESFSAFDDTIYESAYVRGGENVDRELRALVQDIYDLHSGLNINFSDV